MSGNAPRGFGPLRPLRILATSYDYRPRLGGVATLSFELLKAMRGFEGVEVRLLAPEHPKAAEFDATSGIETVRLALPAVAARSVLPLAGAITREAIRRRPDAVLNLLWLPDGAASLLSLPLLTARGIPYFVYAHGVELLESRLTFKKRLRGALSPFKRSVFSGAAGAFTNSSFTRELLLRETGLPAADVHVAHPGVDPEEFFPSEPAPDLVALHGLKGRRVLITVSRLDDYKGVDRVIAALPAVRERHPDVLYLVCGEGPDRSRLESIARHYRVEEQVRFAGAVPFGRLRDYYNLAEVFLLLSRAELETPNIEGFGIVFVEAAACGKPSIGGASGGIADAVGESETGWLVDPNDPAAVARAVIESLDRPELTRRKGEAARERALRELTWKGMARSMLEPIARRTGREVPGLVRD